MANKKSQIKRNRQNVKIKARRLSERSKLKTLSRRFRETLATGDREKAATALKEANQAYDKAAASGAIHSNNAANHKSKLAKALNAK